MTFEEDFPSLKREIKSPDGSIWRYNEEDIQKHCLDKQKVKNAYKKFKEGIIESWKLHARFEPYLPGIEEFEKELGLE